MSSTLSDNASGDVFTVVAEGSVKGLPVPIKTNKEYCWQKPNKFLYLVLCFNGCGLNYNMQCVLASVFTGSLVYGYALSMLNTSISTIGGEFLWCGYEGYRGCAVFRLYSALVQIALFIGAASGALLGGIFLRRLGCLTTFFISDLLFIVGSIFCCVAEAAPTLGVGRIVVGFGLGMTGVSVATYIAEITPPRKRGAYGTTNQILITLGILLGVLLGLPFSLAPSATTGQVEPTAEQISYSLDTLDLAWWRVMCGLTIIPCVIRYCLFKWVFSGETPYYLISQKRYSEAYALLQKLNAGINIDDTFNDIYDNVESTKSKTGVSLKVIIQDPKGRWVLFVGINIAMLFQLTGIDAFTTASNALFANAGLDTDLITTMSIVLTVANLVMTIPAMWTIELLGRRLLLALGAAGMGLSVLPGAIWLFIEGPNGESEGATWTSIAGSILFIIFFSSTWGPVTWVYMFEIMPSDMKDASSGVIVSANYLAGLVMVFFGSYLSTEIVYIICFFVNVYAFGFVVLFVKETRGYTIGHSPYF